MQTIEEKILATLESQKFADWYNTGNFDKYISGDAPTITKEEILAEIKKLFRL